MCFQSMYYYPSLDLHRLYALPMNSDTSDIKFFTLWYSLSPVQESITMSGLSNTYRRNPSKVRDLVLSVWLDRIQQGQLSYL